MMLSAIRSSVLSVLAPLPLVVALVVYQFSDFLSLASDDALFSLAALIFGAAYLIAIWRVRRPQFSFTKGARTWFLVAASGFGVYLLGSFYGKIALHWEGVLLIYLGLVAYLAGKRFAILLVPGVASITLIPLPTIIAAVTTEALAVVLLAAALVSLLVLAKAKKGAQEGCKECGGYRMKGEQFCGFCGKSLSSTMKFGVPAKRLVVTWLTSAVVIALLVGAMVPYAALSSNGLLVIDHRLSGVSGVTALPSFPGWTSTLTGFEGNRTLATYSYVLSGGGGVNATLALSTKNGVGGMSLIDSHPGASVNGSLSLATGQTAVYYTWTEGGQRYTGVLLTSYVTYLSSGHVVQSFAAFLFSQRSAEAGVSRSVLQALAGETSSAFLQSRQGGPALTTVIGPISSNYDYALMAASAVLFGIVVGLARSVDSEATRRSDNAFSLPTQEFDALASLEGEKTRWTGQELERVMKPLGGWGSLSPLLERFVSLGLMEREIGIVDGLPRLFWTSKVGP